MAGKKLFNDNKVELICELLVALNIDFKVIAFVHQNCGTECYFMIR